MLEAFEWYSPADGQHWKRLKSILPSLKEAGVDKIWIPPACKAGFRGSNGYDIYDLYDLGEFDQKGSVATKWGTKDELIDLSLAANTNGIGIIFDAVLNHKAAADYTQQVKAVEVVLTGDGDGGFNEGGAGGAVGGHAGEGVASAATAADGEHGFDWGLVSVEGRGEVGEDVCIGGGDDDFKGGVI